MTLEETIDKAIKAFLEGDDDRSKMEAIKPSKYNKKYFDQTDEEMFPSDASSKESKGKASAKLEELKQKVESM